MISSDNPGRLARDTYTYVHLLIVGGIVATAAADHLLFAEPDAPQHGMGLAIRLGGPALFLLGATLFQWMTTGRSNPRRLLVAALIIGLLPAGPEVAIVTLAVLVTILLTALAVWESTSAQVSPRAKSPPLVLRGALPQRPASALRVKRVETPSSRPAGNQ